MAFTSHFFFRSPLPGRLLASAAVLCCAAMVAVFPRTGGRAAMRTGTAAAAPAPVWREAPARISPAFSVMRGGAPSGSGAAASFLAAFRFAGTFFLYDSEDENASLRRGVLTCLPENRQEIVSEGSVIGGVTVKRLYENRIVLEKDGEEGTLSLGGADGRAHSFFAAEPGTDGDSPTRTRFGEQTADGVWTMDKSALMDYYEELLDSPERLLQVFDSMRPLYAADGEAIEGYVLQNVGEREFFDSVGFREGDVVRKVNALPMTNRGRAEFFIRQVVQDRLNAVVIDIERNGAAKRLVYQVR